MSLTTDPNDPELTRYTGPEAPGPQSKKYLVLAPEEIAKGFTRPFRDKYIHVGRKPRYPLRPLTAEETKNYSKYGYAMYEEYPIGSHATGRFWTQADLDNKGCGVETVMGEQLSATYARNPKFYGATYCVGCRAHFPVEEFKWSADNETVGS